MTKELKTNTISAAVDFIFLNPISVFLSPSSVQGLSSYFLHLNKSCLRISFTLTKAVCVSPSL